MIGRLLDDAGPLAVLDDNGDWRPPDPDDELMAAYADYLNVVHHPVENRELSDHHMPFGVAALARAGRARGLKVELAEPVPQLPPGAHA